MITVINVLVSWSFFAVFSRLFAMLPRPGDSEVTEPTVHTVIFCGRGARENQW